MYMVLHNDLHQLICDCLDFIDVLHHKIISKRFKSIKIKDLYNIDLKYLRNLNDHILKQYIDVTELNASNNSKITTLNHMTKLRKLNITGDCGVGDQGILDLNLEELNAENNPKITTLNHMTKLRKLDISGNCGVGDQGISDLNLEELNASNNSKITILNYMTKLRELNISGNCGVGDQGISDLKLEKVYAWNNPKITSKKLNK